MAKILVVDDNTINRKLLVALLSHDGHLTTEASDGAEALDVALAARPQLVISDIVMPTTDGFEFVRALRADADLRGTPVIFYTANYHEREALNLAQACQVARVLVKPCPPLEILKAVDQVMAGVSESGRFFIPESFDREHLVLMTNKLAEQSDALAASNARLVALGILNVELAADRDSKALLRRVCGGARNLIGARYAVLELKDPASTLGDFVATSGIDPGSPPPSPLIESGHLADVLEGRRSWRSRAVERPDPGYRPGYPPAPAFLAAPLCTPTRSLGWLCLADKIGADAFNEEDERLLTGLGALAGQVYENNALRADLQLQTEVLRRDEDRYRHLAADAAATLERVYAVMGGVNLVAVRARDRIGLCDQVCRLLAVQGRYRLAFVEMLDPPTQQMLLMAAAGDKADAAAFRGTVPQVRRLPHPLFCNDLSASDPDIPNRGEMLARGYHALASLPLLCEFAPVGQLLLFSEQTGVFDAAEMHLVNEVASSISLALTRIAADRMPA